MSDVLFYQNDNLLELDALTNQRTGAYINNATVTVTLTDLDDTEVAGETWPLAMSYVAASDGKYRATLKDSLSLTEGQRYKATITADAGTDSKGVWVVKLLVRKRREGD